VQESNHIQSELFEKISELSNDITAIKETLGFFRGQMEAAKK
jgi:hypothetical protein